MISVIMSVYKEKKQWLSKAIESILNQTYSNFEFIITLDNPENYELKEIIQEYAQKDNRIRFLTNDVNLGLTKSLNNMLSIAQGEYIARMDADDISMNNRLEKQLEYMNSNNIDILGCNVVEFNDSKHNKTNLYISDSDIKRNINRGSYIPHPTWFVKRKVYDVLSGYRDIKYAEDFDFILRAINKKFTLGNMKEPLLKYRLNDESISRKNALKQKLTSIYLLDNQSRIDEITQEDINKSFEKINKEKEEKYLKGEWICLNIKQTQEKSVKIKLLYELVFKYYIYLKYNKIRNIKLFVKNLLTKR